MGTSGCWSGAAGRRREDAFSAAPLPLPRVGSRRDAQALRSRRCRLGADGKLLLGTSVALRGGSGCPGRRSSRPLPRVFASAMATRRYAFASAVIGAARGGY